MYTTKILKHDEYYSSISYLQTTQKSHNIMFIIYYNSYTYYNAYINVSITTR